MQIQFILISGYTYEVFDIYAIWGRGEYEYDHYIQIQEIKKALAGQNP